MSYADMPGIHGSPPTKFSRWEKLGALVSLAFLLWCLVGVPLWLLRLSQEHDSFSGEIVALQHLPSTSELTLVPTSDGGLMPIVGSSSEAWQVTVLVKDARGDVSLKKVKVSREVFETLTIGETWTSP